MIPDMNKVPHSVVDGEKSIDKEEGQISSSTTRSMNLEDFLKDNNTMLFKESKRQLEPETSSGSQVKRLKTNTSDYTGNETKSLMVVEKGASREKGNDIFLRILKCGTSKETSISQNNNLTMKEGEDVSLLHPWIKRWCKNKSTKTHEPGGELEVNTKGTMLEKQFPSMAAMALMGKALSLTPTGRKKTNSVFVWNAQDLR